MTIIRDYKVIFPEGVRKEDVDETVNVLASSPELLEALEKSNRMIVQLWARLSGVKGIREITDEVTAQQRQNDEVIAKAVGRGRAA